MTGDRANAAFLSHSTAFVSFVTHPRCALQTARSGLLLARRQMVRRNAISCLNVSGNRRRQPKADFFLLDGATKLGILSAGR